MRRRFGNPRARFRRKLCAERLEDVPTCARFTRAAPPAVPYPVGARQFKTLFRAAGPFRQIGVHRPRLKKTQTARWANGSGQPMPEAFARTEQRITLWGQPEATDLVQLNHYSVRSVQSFLLKRARGLPNRRRKPIDLTYWVERNFNSVEDASIARHAEATARELTALHAFPGVTDLHAAAHAHHHAAFEALMREEANIKLYGRLLMAAGSAVLPAETARDLIARYQVRDV